MVLHGKDRRQEVHLSGLRGWVPPALLDEDDRDHDYPGLLRSVCPNGYNGASIPIVASCRFCLRPCVRSLYPGATNCAAGTADRNINSEANV